MLNQIPTYRKPNSPLTSSIYLVFLPLEMQERLKQTKVYHTFFTLSEKKRPTNLQKWQHKNPFFQCVCHWYDLLRWMFFIPCNNWKTLLSIAVYCYPEIVLTAIFWLPLKPVFWKKSIVYACLHNNSMMLITKFQNKAVYAV